MVRALAAEAPFTDQQQCLLAATRHACLQQRSQQQRSQQHLQDQYRVHRQLLTFAATTPCHGRTLVVSVELRLRCWPDGSCGDTKQTTGCQVGLRQASTWGHASMGHVSRRGFARRACCCCLLLLLLVAGGAAFARGYTRAAEYPSVSPARGNVV